MPRTMTPTEVLLGLGFLGLAFLALTGLCEFVLWKLRKERKEP